jgi:hypothetical protein
MGQTTECVSDNPVKCYTNCKNGSNGINNSPVGSVTSKKEDKEWR